MQPRAFGDIYYFPVPVAIRIDENLLQAKLTETSLFFSKFYNSSTNTFEINTKKAFKKIYMFYFETFWIILNPSSVKKNVFHNIHYCYYYWA